MAKQCVGSRIVAGGGAEGDDARVLGRVTNGAIKSINDAEEDPPVKQHILPHRSDAPHDEAGRQGGERELRRDGGKQEPPRAARAAEAIPDSPQDLGAEDDEG